MEKLEERLQQLRGLDFKQLRALWKRNFKFETGPHLSIQVLRMAIAYSFPEREHKAKDRVAAVRRLAQRDERRPKSPSLSPDELRSSGQATSACFFNFPCFDDVFKEPQAALRYAELKRILHRTP